MSRSAEDFANLMCPRNDHGEHSVMETEGVRGAATTTIATAMAQARREALEEALQWCGRLADRYSGSAAHFHAIGAESCAQAIRALIERPAPSPGDKEN